MEERITWDELYYTSKGFKTLQEIKHIFIQEARDEWHRLRKEIPELQHPFLWKYIQAAEWCMIANFNDAHTKEDVNGFMLAWRGISFDDWCSSL